MTEKTIERFMWASRVLQLLTLLAGATATLKGVPEPGTTIAAGVATLTGIGAAWCERQIPARPGLKP